MTGLSYVVVTPVRDEEEYLPFTIASMCAQTKLPKVWVLVNDGSQDHTGDLIDAAAARHSWIIGIHRGNRGFRKAGGGVIDAFYEGYALVAQQSSDCVAKFDGDLSFGPDYFERCLDEFEKDPKLGIAGGLCCKMVGHERVPESPGEPRFHVRGPTKIYRRKCFDEIGGLMRAPGWDTIDQLKANLLGWKTTTFPDITLVHHRLTGGAYGSWNDWIKNGLANYITGYDPVFMACKCLRRTFRRPHGNGIGLWFGYVKGYLQRTPRVDDPALIRYLRRQQWRALTFRKSLWR